MYTNLFVFFFASAYRLFFVVVSLWTKSLLLSNLERRNPYYAKLFFVTHCILSVAARFPRTTAGQPTPKCIKCNMVYFVGSSPKHTHTHTQNAIVKLRMFHVLFGCNVYSLRYFSVVIRFFSAPPHRQNGHSNLPSKREACSRTFVADLQGSRREKEIHSF